MVKRSAVSQNTSGLDMSSSLIPNAKKRPSSSKIQKPRLKEGQIQASILDYLRIKNIIHWRIPLGGAFVRNAGKSCFRKSPIIGFSDLLVLQAGKPFFLEVKDATSKQREEQIKFQKDVECAGCFYAIVRSIDDVIALFP